MHSVGLHGLPAVKGMFSGGKPLGLNMKGLRPLHSSQVEVPGFVDALMYGFHIWSFYFDPRMVFTIFGPFLPHTRRAVSENIAH